MNVDLKTDFKMTSINVAELYEKIDEENARQEGEKLDQIAQEYSKQLAHQTNGASGESREPSDPESFQMLSS